MKSIYLCISVFVFAYSNVFAQLKMDYSGNIAIGTTDTPRSLLSVRHSGNSEYAISCLAEYSGLYCESQGTYPGTNYAARFKIGKADGYHDYIGVLSEANSLAPSSSSSIHYSYGVIGKAGYAHDGNFGVVGTVPDSVVGVGIYGSAYGDDHVYLYGANRKVYAGYFNGETKVAGNLTVTGNLQGVLLGHSAATPVVSESKDLQGIGYSLLAQKFEGLRATQYMTDREEDTEEAHTKDLMTSGEQTAQQVKNAIEKQYEAKSHYALSAEQLEKVFPDLVYETENGEKAINYMELIPLLVQSIGELNKRIAELEGGSSEVQMARSGSNAISAATATQDAARLYQNNPNPFTAKTEIRFDLPERTINASICIFDMTGKMLRQIPVNASMTSVTINGYEMAAGIYLYSLIVGGQEIDTKRMILSK